MIRARCEHSRNRSDRLLSARSRTVRDFPAARISSADRICVPYRRSSTDPATFLVSVRTLLTHFCTHLFARDSLTHRRGLGGSLVPPLVRLLYSALVLLSAGNLQSIFRWRIALRLWESDHVPRIFLWQRQIERGTFSLSALRERGPVILEFLRGTW